MLWDHPRIRGEHRSCRWRTAVSAGSSPHTRGARIPADDEAAVPGIIPAYAGSTESGRDQGDRYCGSSPHTRGALVLQLGRFVELGIIPAYAGSTSILESVPALEPDHPRIRGEHKRAFKNARIVVGSSPHTRGAPTATNASSPTGRIIPAYAGSTQQSASKGSSRSDHPRIRGEHLRQQHLPRPGGGSSPHTRGAPDSRRRPPRGAPDHPRIRGEHATWLRSSATKTGSSPHTRGALDADVVISLVEGIIPAYAGSTRSENAIIRP